MDNINEILAWSGHFNSLPKKRTQPIACANVMIVHGAKGTWYEQLEGVTFFCEIVFKIWRRPDGASISYIGHFQVIYLTKTTIKKCGYLSPNDVVLL